MVHKLDDKEARARLKKQKLTALEPYPGSVQQAWKVRCDLCHSPTTVRLDVLKKRIYPGCADCGSQRRAEDNSISEKEALRRAKAADLTPLDPYPGHTKTPWRCRCNRCGSEAFPIANNLLHHRGCLTCGRERTVEARRLSAREARQRMTRVGLTPIEPYPGAADQPWKARCRACGSIVSPRPTSLTRQGGCRVCGDRRHANRRIEQHREEAEALARDLGFVPMEPYPGRRKPWKVHCSSCSSTVRTYASSMRAGHGCPNCAPNARLTKAEVRRLLKKAGRELLVDYTNSYDRLPMRCVRCGAETKASIGSLVNSRGGCQNCKPTAKFSSDEAVRLMVAAGVTPLEPYTNAQTPWRCRCQICGTVGEPRLGNVRSGQRGCRVCGNYGYDINKPALLYVLVHREHDAVKIGITNAGSVRLRDLKRVGWREGKVFEFDEGRTPLRIETLVLRRIRNELKLKPALTQRQMRGVRGATETFRRADLSPRTVYRWVRALMDKEPTTGDTPFA